MDKDLDQAKGRAKQAIADLKGDEALRREGRNDERAGKAKEFIGDVRDKADDAIDKVKDTFNKKK